jgi:hypothetical protein
MSASDDEKPARTGFEDVQIDDKLKIYYGAYPQVGLCLINLRAWREQQGRRSMS